MGTILTRTNKQGATRYTAINRRKKGGTVVHNGSETFARKAHASEWMRRRESELDSSRARGEPFGKRYTLGELMERPLNLSDAHRFEGAKMRKLLAALAAMAIATAAMACPTLNGTWVSSHDLTMAFAREHAKLEAMKEIRRRTRVVGAFPDGHRP